MCARIPASRPPNLQVTEAGREFSPVQDWTLGDVDALTLYVHGKAGNGQGTLYVVMEDSAGKTAMAANPDPQAVPATEWIDWKIPLSSLTGPNLARVNKLYVGVGDRDNSVAGGAGPISRKRGDANELARAIRRIGSAGVSVSRTSCPHVEGETPSTRKSKGRMPSPRDRPCHNPIAPPCFLLNADWRDRGQSGRMECRPVSTGNWFSMIHSFRGGASCAEHRCT